MEEQIQLLEEQKEVLAQSLETTRSQLQDFQDAAGELEARRQDVERHQILLQQNAGQEAQGSDPCPPLDHKHLSNYRNITDYIFLFIPLGIFIVAYLLREWLAS